MNTSRLLAAAAITMLAAMGAQAETYEGVHQPVAALSRADVNVQAVAAAAAPDQNVTRGSRGAEPFTAVASRDTVRAQAVRTAAAPDQNVTSGSRVNSKVVSTLQNPVDARQRATSAAGQNAS